MRARRLDRTLHFVCFPTAPPASLYHAHLLPRCRRSRRAGRRPAAQLHDHPRRRLGFRLGRCLRPPTLRHATPGPARSLLFRVHRPPRRRRHLRSLARGADDRPQHYGLSQRTQQRDRRATNSDGPPQASRLRDGPFWEVASREGGGGRGVRDADGGRGWQPAEAEGAQAGALPREPHRGGAGAAQGAGGRGGAGGEAQGGGGSGADAAVRTRRGGRSGRRPSQALAGDVPGAV